MSFLGHGRLDDLHRQEMAKLESGTKEGAILETRKFQVGQAVEVHSFGRWYPGKVASIGRTRVKATYTTGTGTTRTRAFPLNLVRAAGGAK